MRFQFPKTDEQIAANPWEHIADEWAQELLEVVPPRRIGKHGFMVGETLCHTHAGEPVYDVVMRVEKNYYMKPDKLTAYDENRYETEIRAQLQAEQRTEEYRFMTRHLDDMGE